MPEAATRPTTIAAITFDCEDARALAGFWSDVLSLPVHPGPPDPSPFFARLSGGDTTPEMLFLKVPEGKTAKNRVHLDLACGDRGAEIDRLIGLGATHVHDKDEWGMTWTTLRDPEGNEFCITDAH